MNLIVETEVKEIALTEQAAVQTQAQAVVEIDALSLALIGGGWVSPCFA